MAFERLLVPFVAERILALDRDLVVLDKPIGLPVHGGDESLAGDVVERLAALLVARGEPSYLGVHQRLDQGTSGVLFFTRRAELNALVAREMEAHRARRTYHAAVALGAGCALAPAGELEHRLETTRGQTRVVERGGREAALTYRVLERRGERALLELEPRTGRTHQIRVQLAAVGAPIAGDAQYGGPAAWRLMLHACRLELGSLGRSFIAEPPPDLALWVRGEAPALGSTERLTRALADAGALRYPLCRRADAFRLANDLGDGLPGVTIDRYADFAVLETSTPEAQQRSAEVAEHLVAFGARGVYLKVRRRGGTQSGADLLPREPVAGEHAPALLEVREAELRFLVALGEGAQTGLFLDQRESRARIRALSSGARVLNLFSYTCAFSVAAASGGAALVTSVDVSSRALSRGREQFALNGLDARAHRFVQEDAVAWLGRAARRGERFDVIVLDPPSFATRAGRGAFSAERGYAPLAAAALRLLSPGGRLLAVTNHRKTSQPRFRRVLHEALRAAGRNAAQMKDLASPLDFPARLGEPFPSKSVVIRVD